MTLFWSMVGLFPVSRVAWWRWVHSSYLFSASWCMHGGVSSGFVVVRVRVHSAKVVLCFCFQLAWHLFNQLRFVMWWLFSLCSWEGSCRRPCRTSPGRWGVWPNLPPPEPRSSGGCTALLGCGSERRSRGWRAGARSSTSSQTSTRPTLWYGHVV